MKEHKLKTIKSEMANSPNSKQENKTSLQEEVGAAVYKVTTLSSSEQKITRHEKNP